MQLQTVHGGLCSPTRKWRQVGLKIDRAGAGGCSGCHKRHGRCVWRRGGGYRLRPACRFFLDCQDGKTLLEATSLFGDKPVFVFRRSLVTDSHPCLWNGTVRKFARKACVGVVNQSEPEDPSPRSCPAVCWQALTEKRKEINSRYIRIK